MGGETIYHNCSFCADRFSLSAALLMHKVQCHSWDSHGHPVSFDTFIDELINEESKHLSDANFNYTFSITTSVTQTAKECIVKAEPFIEVIPDDIDFIKMDISEPIILEQTFALPSASSLDPTKTLCPLCGKEKSTKNMRRHMNKVHKTEIDPDFEATLRARLKKGISQVSDEEESLLEDNNIYDPLIPSHYENHTNVAYDEDTTSMDYQSFESSSQEYTIQRIRSKTRSKEKTDTCRICGKVMVARSMNRHLTAKHTANIPLKPEIVSAFGEINEFQEMCPICQRIGYIRNLKRHLILVHEFTESQLKGVNLRSSFKCLKCLEVHPRSEIEVHFMESHNIRSSTKIRSLHVTAGLPQTNNPLHEPITFVMSNLEASSEANVEHFHEHGEDTVLFQAKRPKDKIDNCPVCGKELIARSMNRHLTAVHTVNILEESEIRTAIGEHNAFQEMCPICQRVGYIRNLKRHLIVVHKFTESQLNDVNLRASFKCLLCLEVHPRSEIEVHFMESHNIISSTKVRSLHVTAGLPETDNPLHDPIAFALSEAASQPNLEDNIDFLYEQKGARNVQPVLDLEPEHSRTCKPTVIAANDLQPIKSIIDRKSKLRSIIKCTMCDYKGTAHALNMHYKIMHNQPNKCNEPIALIYRKGKRGYNCTLCLYDVTTRAAILEHLLSDHSETINHITGISFECDICPKVLPSFTDFEAHQNQHIFKLGLDQFFCDYCGIFKRSKNSLTQHMALHMNLRSFTCDICQKGFNKKHTLSEHMITHSNEKPYECTVDGCDWKYARKGTWREHMQLRHFTTKNPHQCEICGKNFQLKKYLKLHSYIHGVPREYRCKSCFTICPSRQRLKSHRAKYCKTNCIEDNNKAKQNLLVH